MTFCCEMMRDKVETECDQHRGVFDCPDNLVYYDPDPSDEHYGLIIHDGGSSYIAIRYCPWCGGSLPVGADDDDESTG